MSEVFNNQMLVEKLSKLNNSQQSIQTLSNWCVIHRKKAKIIVETWDEAFNNSPNEKRVPFLYLANDILQNSRRQGSEFVNEFWKVLPGCLKNVYENGEDHGKKVVNRLALCSCTKVHNYLCIHVPWKSQVEIWDDRKVFGSRGRGLKDEILGTVPVPVSNNGKSNSNPIKLIRKDANSVRVKLAVGEMPEKIVTAYQSVLDEHSSEDTALSKCKDAVQVLEKMEKGIDVAGKQGHQLAPAFMSELQNQETVLKQCIEQLEAAKSTRAMLVYQLTEALKEQEFKLDFINDQLQIAHSLNDHAGSMRQRLLGFGVGASGSTSMAQPANISSEAKPLTESNLLISIPQLLPPNSVTSFAGSISSAEDDHKKAAAAVAAKLTASSSSAQVLSSILSSLAAEEAASIGNSLNSQVLSDGQASFPLEKKPRLEKLITMPDMGKTSYFGQMQLQQHQSIPFAAPQTSSANIQLSQSNQAPPTFAPPLPPLPPLPPPPLQQFAQTSGVTNIGPYAFAAGSLPPPPLSHLPLGFTRPSIPPVPPPPPPPPSQQQQQQQLQSTSMGFYQSPGVGFYGQPQTAPTAQPQ
ncbi:actin cytoskeleton-regulatory complex protein pan1-like isoform X1 [Zingiber officinale]|uniref:actin cytoskeleton-regulatory complex protein pan1-like isoform X1 n=1 Tax=Zingiber officinale TaxID=94328 RepID=UPI001C4ADD73|nr:actin cytoskeleton-regulatory complex protein pan1-like isoform X1 [Zingiber officinale]XP_042428014.1 actin cytoskeleton-regulatory complex protein pan1-like isoform X1 [Zingiber officinale]